MTRVLGIDPGIALTGWGCVEKNGSAEAQLVKYGCIKTSSKEKIDIRLFSIVKELKRIIRDVVPDVIVVEEMYFTKNIRPVLNIAHARGAALSVPAEMGIPVLEYNPRKVKLALTGYGSADKNQMQVMVQKLLMLQEMPKPDDAADALAVAMCHLQTLRV